MVDPPDLRIGDGGDDERRSAAADRDPISAVVHHGDHFRPVGIDGVGAVAGVLRQNRRVHAVRVALLHADGLFHCGRSAARRSKFHLNAGGGFATRYRYGDLSGNAAARGGGHNGRAVADADQNAHGVDLHHGFVTARPGEQVAGVRRSKRGFRRDRVMNKHADLLLREIERLRRRQRRRRLGLDEAHDQIGFAAAVRLGGKPFHRLFIAVVESAAEARQDVRLVGGCFDRVVGKHRAAVVNNHQTKLRQIQRFVAEHIGDAHAVLVDLERLRADDGAIAGQLPAHVVPIGQKSRVCHRLHGILIKELHEQIRGRIGQNVFVVLIGADEHIPVFKRDEPAELAVSAVAVDPLTVLQKRLALEGEGMGGAVSHLDPVPALHFGQNKGTARGVVAAVDINIAVAVRHDDLMERVAGVRRVAGIVIFDLGEAVGAYGKGVRRLMLFALIQKHLPTDIAGDERIVGDHIVVAVTQLLDPVQRSGRHRRKIKAAQPFAGGVVLHQPQHDVLLGARRNFGKQDVIIAVGFALGEAGITLQLHRNGDGGFGVARLVDLENAQLAALVHADRIRVILVLHGADVRDIAVVEAFRINGQVVIGRVHLPEDLAFQIRCVGSRGFPRRNRRQHDGKQHNNRHHT